MTMGWGRREAGHRGFTFVELLVVILIISILAAIGIPLFIRQRDKAKVAQTQSILANAKTVAESWYVGDGKGTYTDLECGPCDPSDGNTTDDAIWDEGLRFSSDIQILIDASAEEYCIIAIHLLLPTNNVWHLASVHERGKAPEPDSPPFCVPEPAP
jgi:prepilin-type N-terminal cleavage/methylation domain-containing protein